MKFNTIQIASPSALNFEFTPSAPICILRGHNSELALDLMRELIGDFGAQNDPDRIDDGRFVIHADVEMDGKNYSACYIRNADFMGDSRLAVNFDPGTTSFSEDDTREFINKCGERGADGSNVLIKTADASSPSNDRPIFIYDFLDRLDEARDASPIFDKLASLGSQVFIAVCADYPAEKIKHNSVSVVLLDDGESDLPPVGTDYNVDHTVILCPVCGLKTLDNHAICPHCGWEYDGFPEDHYSAANGATLADYREQYKQALKERNVQDV